MPLRLLTLLVTLLHVYTGLRLLPALATLTGGWPLLLAALLLSAATMPLPFIGARAGARRGGPAHGWKWLGLLSMGWFSSIFVLTLVRDAGLLLAWALAGVGGASIDSAAAQSWSAAAVALVSTLVTLIGFFNARRTASVVRVDVPIRGLPASLEGFTIAQLSDIHVGPTIRRGYLQRIVDAVNRLGADMVAITGDLVDGTVSELREHVAPLAGLRARHGTFVVTGNHEYYAGAHAWIAELRRLGLRVLLNEHVVLQTRNVKGAQTEEEMLDSALVVAGVTDYTAVHFDAAHASDPQRALQDAPPLVRTRLLLAHQPRSAPAAAEAGYQLQLSGHTHGGQFFPWNLFVPLQQPFTAGLHRLREMWVYTSRGTGYWGPPKRFGAPSEITLLRLVPERL
ncbi:metallophosphoesterase [Variovorax soli]|uniref:MPP superfamily phosphohydrolase n=1 Tax=Variovorax soli TaxID=376815 RepID=A0ABU1N7Y6_9BURK|nr:metallophosphoesterase [Variovorax soli]MDR6534550.1 putative MPP superfamily phosphohydrolase [Variovorax soli]